MIAHFFFSSDVFSQGTKVYRLSDFLKIFSTLLWTDLSEGQPVRQSQGQSHSQKQIRVDDVYCPRLFTDRCLESNWLHIDTKRGRLSMVVLSGLKETSQFEASLCSTWRLYLKTIKSQTDSIQILPLCSPPPSPLKNVNYGYQVSFVILRLKINGSSPS